MGPTERPALSWGGCPAVYDTAPRAAEPHRRSERGRPRPQQCCTCTRVEMLQLRVFLVIAAAEDRRAPLRNRPRREGGVEPPRPGCEDLAGTGIRVAKLDGAAKGAVNEVV